MKNIKKIVLLSLSTMLLASCIEDDTNYTTTEKPVVSMTGQTETSVVEGETITVTLATDKTYKERMDFKLELVSGGQNADYFVSDADGEEVGDTSVDDGFGDFGYKIEFPAYAETHTFNITAKDDALAEGTENLRFKLTSTDNGNGLVTNNEINFELEVLNRVDDVLVATLDFDKTVSYKTIERNIIETELDDEEVNHTESLCDLIDYDFYLGANASFYDCPEVISVAGLGDGSYSIFVQLWAIDLGLDEDVNEVLNGDFALPFTLHVDHYGSFNSSIDFPTPFFSNTVTAENGGNATILVGELQIVNGKYILLNANGDVVAAE